MQAFPSGLRAGKKSACSYFCLVLIFLTASITIASAQVPVISSFSPTSGPVGTTVTITGTNFDPVAGNNIVYFGVVKATVTAATGTSLAVTAPAGATYQPITVITNGLIGYSQTPFVVTFPNSCQSFTSSSFSMPVRSFPASDVGPAGDIDGDGKVDVVVSKNQIARNTSNVGTPSFQPVNNLFSTNGLALKAIGDLDGDGRLDVTGANYNANTISIFRNTSSPGSFSFGSEIIYSTADNDLPTLISPNAIYIGDLDGDGKPELAVTYQFNNIISIFRNTSTIGNISFAPKIEFRTQLRGEINRICIGDLDKDGKADFAVSELEDNIVSIFRSTGTPGIISFASRLDFPVGYSDNDIALGDLNNDGKPDIAVANSYNGSVTVLENKSGSGSISFGANSAFLTGSRPVVVEISDLDGDGAPELVTRNYNDNTLSVLKNLTANGTFAFAKHVDYTTRTISGGNFAIIDVDNDGKLDIVGAFMGAFSVLRNQIAERPCLPTTNLTPGISSFTPASGPVGSTVVVTGTNFDPIASNNTVYFGAVKATVVSATATSLTVPVPAGTTYQPISVTVNHLTAYARSPFVVTFQNNGPGIFVANSFAQKTELRAIWPLDNPIINDVDGDGKADLTVLNKTNPGTISVYKNISANGVTNLASPNNFIVGNTLPYNVASADLNGDGKPDFVVGTNEQYEIPASVTILRNTSVNGSVSFARTDFNISGKVVIGDIDRDGKPDLVVLKEPLVSVYRNTSEGDNISFDIGVSFDIGGGSGTFNFDIADLNGDEKPDLIGIGSSYVFLRNISVPGIIDFAPASISNNGGNNPGKIGICDLDGDGKPELVSLENYIGKVYIFKNNSTSDTILLTPEIAYATGTQPTSVAINDLDGDGKPDLAVTNAGSKTVSIYKNTSTIGKISLLEKEDYAMGAQNIPTGIAIGDFDADSKPDLAISNGGSSNTIVIWRNQIGEIPCVEPTFKNDPTISLDASCANNDGNISIIPTGGTAPFMYSKDGGVTYVSGADAGSGFMGLSARVYKLRLKDANGCESAIVEREIKLNCATTCTAPTFLNNNLIVLDASCADNDGNITIEPTSGTAPFMYSIDRGTSYISGPNAGYTFANLASGIYNLRLKDAKGCESAVVERTVKYNCATCTPPTFLNGLTIVLNASCANNDGNITIEPTSGTGPFMYSINGGTTYVSGPNYGYTFANLAAGNYDLRLKDVRGCESSVVERTVQFNCGTCTPPTFKNDLTIVLNPSCANNDGIITIEPTSGTGPFMYSKDGGTTYVSGPNYGYSFGNLSTGTYRLRLKDVTGCESAIVEKTLSIMSGIPCAQTSAAAVVTAIGKALPKDAISAYPNPTKGQFKLQLKGFTSSKAEVSIFNGEGKMVQKRQLNVAGTKTVDFDLTGRAKGMYYIKITSNSGTRTSKVLVQ